jgi:hypothetical protein
LLDLTFCKNQLKNNSVLGIAVKEMNEEIHQRYSIGLKAETVSTKYVTVGWDLFSS